MDCYLLVDFGSTFTKLTLVSKDRQDIIAKSKSYTTVETSVIEGYEKAKSEMLKYLKCKEDINIIKTLCCSSAGGGLKIVTIGITPSYTVEATKRVVMGAGGRIVASFSYYITDEDLEIIKKTDYDIILLSGGTEGGNKSYILANAKKLAEHMVEKPIVVAGNSNARNEIKKIFKNYGIKAFYTENIMPDTDKINPYAAKEVIREIFMNLITKANGMNEVAKHVGEILMPTPTAVLNAAVLLSKGTEKTKGLGELIIVDVGGATTDVHSISNPVIDISYKQEGLEEMVEKRTVEGDLGMRYSSIGVYQSGSKILKEKVNAKEKCIKRFKQTSFIPEDEEEREFDELLASECVEIAVKRHAGTIRQGYLNGQNVYIQNGKDLRNIKYIVGTGGAIINSVNYRKIISSCIKNESKRLIPKRSKILLDREYILSAMGLLSTEDSELALNIMIKNIN